MLKTALQRQRRDATALTDALATRGLVDFAWCHRRPRPQPPPGLLRDALDACARPRIQRFARTLAAALLRGPHGVVDGFLGAAARRAATEAVRLRRDRAFYDAEIGSYGGRQTDATRRSDVVWWLDGAESSSPLLNAAVHALRALGDSVGEALFAAARSSEAAAAARRRAEAARPGHASIVEASASELPLAMLSCYEGAKRARFRAARQDLEFRQKIRPFYRFPPRLRAARRRRAARRPARPHRDLVPERRVGRRPRRRRARGRYS